MAVIAPGAEREALKAVFWHTGAFFSYIFAVFFVESRGIIAPLGAIMWAFAALFCWVRPNERTSAILRLEQTMFAYSWGAIFMKFLIGLVIGIPVLEWQRMLQVPMPEAVVNSIQGYLNLAFLIFLILTPNSYVLYVLKNLFIFKTTKTPIERRKEIMRKNSDGLDIDIR